MLWLLPHMIFSVFLKDLRWLTTLFQHKIATKGGNYAANHCNTFLLFFLFCSSSKSFSFFSMGKFSSQQHFKSWLETKKSDIFLGFKSFLEDFGRRGSTKWQKNWGTLWKILIFVQKINFDQNFTLRHIWIFALKLEDIFEYFILKKYLKIRIENLDFRNWGFSKIEFSANIILSKIDFSVKLNSQQPKVSAELISQQNWSLSKLNFSSKLISQQNWVLIKKIFNFKFKIFHQNGLKNKIQIYTSFRKIDFLDKK